MRRVLGIFGRRTAVELAIRPVVDVRILPARLSRQSLKRRSCEQPRVSLPCVLFASAAKASPFHAVTKCIVDRAEQIVGKHWKHCAVVVWPLEPGGCEHRVVAVGNVLVGTVAVRRRKDLHRLVVAHVAQGVPAAFEIVALRIAEAEAVTRSDEVIVLRAGLLDQVLVRLFDLRVVTGVDHVGVRLSQPRGELGVNLYILGLSLEIDAVLLGILFG